MTGFSATATILSLATPRIRKQLVQQGGREIVNCISECCVNILKGNLRFVSEEKILSFQAQAKNSEKLQRKKSVQNRKSKLFNTEDFL